MVLTAPPAAAIPEPRSTSDDAGERLRRSGCGEYLGRCPGFGHWVGVCVGHVAYWVLITSTIGTIVSALGDGATVLSMAISSVGLWLFLPAHHPGSKVLGPFGLWTVETAATSTPPRAGSGQAATTRLP
ncbi:hypothetical protein [Streptomyces sp. NPDC057616]|uniref:hypothetical protein n=1 Tax=Streptomyces sp. NPDC057616 TaxID=3346183 RepID=UPI0036D179FC